MSTLASREGGRQQRSFVAARLATYRRQILRILIADINAAEVEHAVQELKRAQFAVSADVVHSEKQFVERLRAQPYDIILADCSMPGWTGMQALEFLQEQGQIIPFILVTRVLEQEIVEEFIRRGASDWVDKNHLARLPAAVAMAVEEKAQRDERNRIEKALQHLEARYRALIENPTFGICQFDVDGKFVDVNQTLVKMLGYQSRNELIAVNFARDVIRNPAERERPFGPYLREGRIECVEIEWSRKDGTPIRVRLSGCEVRDEQGGRDGCEIIAEEVSERGRTELHEGDS
jgi:PAS domain S-box-containing protein